LSKTVGDLQKGQAAVICDFEENEVPLKLMEMGCLPGSRVKMLQSAPFSDPLYLDINGTHLAIRRETAVQIRVEIDG
jgi:ferrous iron transport protein A